MEFEIVMTQDLPPDLSIDDAVALILSIDYLPGSIGLLEMLSYFREEAEANQDHATSQDQRAICAAQVLMHQFREGLARATLDTLDAELSAIRNGKDSELELVDLTFGSERLVTSSVLCWAAQRGFGINGWKPPRFWRRSTSRTFSTEYLDILDDVIATFCEEGGEHYEPGVIPKKEVIASWVKERYENVSEKVLDVFGTIVRPGLTRTTRPQKTR